MDDADREKIEKIVRDRNEAHRFYSVHSKVYRAFVEMETKTFTGGELDKKVKELIAIGISVQMNCDSCMEWHIREALESGATKEQIIEAVEVGIEMGGGPATVSARFAMKVLEYYSSRSDSNRSIA
jgi:AhpD family alkylhydroperoxidase